jgi:hypothetical protein
MVNETFWIIPLPQLFLGAGLLTIPRPQEICGSKLFLLANAGKATTGTAARGIEFRTKCGQPARIASAIVTYVPVTWVRRRA